MQRVGHTLTPRKRGVWGHSTFTEWSWGDIEGPVSGEGRDDVLLWCLLTCGQYARSNAKAAGTWYGVTSPAYQAQGTAKSVCRDLGQSYYTLVGAAGSDRRYPGGSNRALGGLTATGVPAGHGHRPVAQCAARRSEQPLHWGPASYAAGIGCSLKKGRTRAAVGAAVGQEHWTVDAPAPRGGKGASPAP